VCLKVTSLCLFPSTQLGRTLAALSAEQQARHTDPVQCLTVLATGTEPARQRLIFDGQQLEDHELCSSYKINEGATLHLVWKLHGVPSSPTM